MKNPIQAIPFKDNYINQTLAFLTEFSPDHPELGNRELFLWQQCQRYIAISNEKIVGHMAIIRQIFKFHETNIEIGWGATLVLDMNDFAVKTFAGTALLDQCMNDLSYAYAGVGIVPEIESTYTRRGFVVCRESVKLYARFFKAKKALRYYNKPDIYAIPINIINLIKPMVKGNGRIDELEQVQYFESSLDDHWDKYLSSRYKMYGERTAKFLNYKISQPNKMYYVFMHKDPDGQIDGYIIYRKAHHILKDLTIIKVCDVVGSDTARSALLAHTLDFARYSDVDGIVGLGSKNDEQFYRECGLWLSRPMPVGLRPEFRGKIHLSFFDSDLDNLW